jgi:hypothetical protein
VLPASIREKVPLAFALEFLETVYDWNCFGFVPPQIDFTEYRALLPPDWDGWVRLLNAWLDYSEEGTTPPRGGLTKDEAAFNAACFEDVRTPANKDVRTTSANDSCPVCCADNVFSVKCLWPSCDRGNSSLTTLSGVRNLASGRCCHRTVLHFST